MSHFSAIGLDAGDQDAFMRTIDSVFDAAVEDAPATPPAAHLRWTDPSGASLALHLSGPATIACLTPFFAPPQPTRWRVRSSAPSDDAGCTDCGGADCDVLDERGELVTCATVQWLHYRPFREWLTTEREYELEVAAFAHRIGCYPTQEAFDADQASWLPGLNDDSQLRGLATSSFISEGVFAESGDVGERATALFAGTIEAARRLTNTHTGRKFWHVRVATLPGSVDVVTDSCEGDPMPGALVMVRGWLVGRPIPR